MLTRRPVQKLSREAALFLVAVTLTVAGWGSISSAQEGRAAIVPVCLSQAGDSPQLASELCGHLSVHLSTSKRWRLVSLDQALAVGGDFDPASGVLGARDMLDTAREAFEGGDRKEAQRLYRRASESMIGLEPWLVNRDLLAQTLLEQVEAEMTKRGRGTPKAEEVALQLFLFVPEMREGWRRKLRPGPVYDLLEKVSGEFDPSKIGRLEIGASQEASEVYVDGQLKGVTPLELVAVPAGEHLVRVRKPGYIPYAQVVTVVPDDRTTVNFELERSHGATAYSRTIDALPAEIGAPKAGNALRDLRGLLTTDQVLAIRVLPVDEEGMSVVEAYLYDLRSEQLLGAIDITKRLGPDTNYSTLVTALVTELVEAEERQLSATDSQVVEQPWYDGVFNAWWFWTGVGAVVLVAGTVAVVSLIDDDEPITPPGATGPVRDPSLSGVVIEF